MTALPYISAFMGLFFIVVETARRGLSYFSINATTMIEDYLCGALLLSSAYLWFRSHALASVAMIVGWAYATGGLFVPFAAHLEAWIRGATFRPDHPHDEIGIIVLKGVIWMVCLLCLVASVRHAQREA